MNLQSSKTIQTTAGIFLKLFIPCIVSLWSCEEKSKSPSSFNLQVIKVEPNKTDDSFSNLINEQKLIRLEAPDSILIREINRIKLSSKHIFISDNAAIFVYDTTGRLVSLIKNLGKGPGQYKTISDFSIDTLKNQVEIMDNQHRTFMTYDFNGHLVSERSIPLVAIAYARSNDLIYFYSGNEINLQSSYSLNETDSEKYEISSKYFPISPDDARYLHIRFPYHFYTYKNSVRFFKPLNDTIFSLSNKTIASQYAIDFGKNRIDPEELFSMPHQNIMDFFNVLRSKEYAFNVANILENENYLFFTYHFQTETFHVAFDKSSQQVFQTKKIKYAFLNRHTQPATTVNFGKAIRRNTVYSVMESYEFVTIMDSLKKTFSAGEWASFETTNQQAANLYGKIRIDDNPILIVSHIKQ